MDGLMNIASQAMAPGGQQKQEQEHQQGAPHESGGGGGGLDIGNVVSAVAGGGGGGEQKPQGGGGGADASPFASLASSLLSKKDDMAHEPGPSDDEIKESHRLVQGSEPVSSNNIASSAAVNAVQSMFKGGGGSEASSSEHQDSGLQGKLISTAMSHASDIFESKQAQGLISSASKNEVVQQAGQTVMKMMMKQQVCQTPPPFVPSPHPQPPSPLLLLPVQFSPSLEWYMQAGSWEMSYC